MAFHPDSLWHNPDMNIGITDCGSFRWPSTWLWQPLHQRLITELLFIHMGRGTISIADQDYLARAGDVFLIPPQPLAAACRCAAAASGDVGAVSVHGNYLHSLAALSTGG